MNPIHYAQNKQMAETYTAHVCHFVWVLFFNSDKWRLNSIAGVVLSYDTYSKLSIMQPAACITISNIL